MPSCNAHGIEGDWQATLKDTVRTWFDTLVEKPIREEKNLIHDNTDEELAYIANWATKAQEVVGAGGSGSAAAEDDEEANEEAKEEVEDEAKDEPTEELPEEPIEEQGDEATEE